jgi:hypothetical protein
MDDTSQTLKPWVIFAGCVLVVVVLDWAQAVVVPIALAVLLTFVLTPAVGWLERWLGRVPAVLAAVTLVFIVLGLAGWGLARQMDHLADDLPTYRVNILAKIADVRGAGKGGSVEKLQETIEGIKTDLGQSSAPTGTPSRPVVVTSELVTGFTGFSWLGPIVDPVGTAGLVLALVIFMLLERRDLRDRLIGLFGYGQLTVTTRALQGGFRTGICDHFQRRDGERRDRLLVIFFTCIRSGRLLRSRRADRSHFERLRTSHGDQVVQMFADVDVGAGKHDRHQSSDATWPTTADRCPGNDTADAPMSPRDGVCGPGRCQWQRAADRLAHRQR